MYQLPSALAPLAAWAQFIIFELVPVPDVPGKSEKYPCDYRTGRRTPKDSGGAHNPEFWTTVDIAAEAAERYGSHCVGFVITADDPICCLDMDDCASVMGDGWIPEVDEMLSAFPGAVEVSVSGRGLHVWATYTGAAPEHTMKAEYKRGKKWLEFYTDVRAMALGSDAVGEMVDVTALLPDFVAEFFPPRVAAADGSDGWQDGPCENYTYLSDEKIIAKALSHTRLQGAAAAFAGHKKGAGFSDLWTRNVRVLAVIYPPSEGKEIGASDADFALAKELAYWTGRDHARIERLMLQSAMVRDKWHEKRRRGTYLQETILEAVAMCTAVYYIPPVSLPAPPPPGSARKLLPSVIRHSTYVAREEMAELFAGCVYVQDQNKILLPNGDIVDQPRFRAKFAGRSFGMCNDNTSVKPTKDAWEAFLSNEVIAFPRVEGTEFNPRLEYGEVVTRYERDWINVYKTPDVVRVEGDVSRFMDLLYKILPHGDDALILLCYMAAVVQYPGVKFRWAPFLQGTQGNGKSTLIECLKYAIGNRYIFSVKSHMITKNFNAWMEHNILYIADDIYSTADRNDIMEALKSLITDGDQPIELKGIDSIQKRTVGNFMFTDNHKDAMRTQDESRRIAPLYSAQQSAWDRRRDGLTESYFKGAEGLYAWLEREGGYAAVAHLLATMEIDPRYNPAGDCQEAPVTSVRDEAITDGRTQLEHDVAEWIELDEPGFCGDFVSVDMFKRKVAAIPAYSRSMGPLKIKELLGRLGYEQHRGLPGGRTVDEVAPDGKRTILYVHRDSGYSELDDPALIAELYTQAQQAAQIAAVSKRFLMGDAT